jgi:predicted nucleic acid-binding protein
VGLILDSSILIAGERGRETVKQVIERVHAAFGDVECALSVVSIVELTHGIYRAKPMRIVCGAKPSPTSYPVT